MTDNLTRKILEGNISSSLKEAVNLTHRFREGESAYDKENEANVEVIGVNNNSLTRLYQRLDGMIRNHSREPEPRYHVRSENQKVYIVEESRLEEN